MQPEVTARQLGSDLRSLGLAPGNVVLVHSSLSGLGRVSGGADSVIDALLEVVSPGGTIVFPTLTGASTDGPDCPPSMDVLTTPCWTGRIPETARQRPEARRSLHPTHSVAVLGAGAERYSAGHEVCSSPCDEHSPYHRLISDGGLILLLGGVTQDSNTTLHCLEELAAVPYHLQPHVTESTVIDAGGARHIVRNRLHLWKWTRDFPKVDAPLAESGALWRGTVGCAEARLMSAKHLADTILPILRKDRLYLLDEQARRSFSASTT